MTHLKKLIVAAMAVVTAVALCVPALAFAAGETGSITIHNAAKGETYSIYKVLGATTNASGGIDYTGTIPTDLQSVIGTVTYTEDGKTYTTIGKLANVTDAQVVEALETWVAKQEGAASYDAIDFDNLTKYTAQTTATGSTVEFTNIEAGYYVIISSQGEHVIMVDSATDPTAEVYEKNTTEIINKGKEADGYSYSIGDTITFTATFQTSNYYGTGENAGKIYKYVINDTLPEYLSNVAITSITIDGEAWDDAPAAFDANKSITIPWVDDDEESLYANGAEIVVTYTAKLTSLVNVNAGNKNTIGITPFDKNDEPYSDPYEDEAEITTYAAALKKTAEDGETTLAGAKFAFYGLVVEKTADGVYTVVSFDPESDDLGTEMEVGSDGMLYVVGLGADEGYDAPVGIETVAPNGYNKLTSEVTLTPQVLEKEVYKASGVRYYDAKGNLVSSESSAISTKEVENNLSDLEPNAVVVINKSGAELPSTGGIGTTIFYIIGAILVIGAGVVLITKRRVAAARKDEELL